MPPGLFGCFLLLQVFDLSSQVLKRVFFLGDLLVQFFFPLDVLLFFGELFLQILDLGF